MVQNLRIALLKAILWFNEVDLITIESMILKLVPVIHLIGLFSSQPSYELWISVKLESWAVNSLNSITIIFFCFKLGLHFNSVSFGYLTELEKWSWLA